MSKSVASSRTTSYNPQGNGQTESYNGIIWKAITMAVKSRNLPPKCWQIVLPDALHSIRSLLSTAPNVTPHERLFNFARRSTAGGSVPTWLCTLGPILLKRHVRHSKATRGPSGTSSSESLVRSCPLPRCRETTVLLRHLAPTGELSGDERPKSTRSPRFCRQYTTTRVH